MGKTVDKPSRLFISSHCQLFPSKTFSRAPPVPGCGPQDNTPPLSTARLNASVQEGGDYRDTSNLLERVKLSTPVASSDQRDAKTSAYRL